MQEWRVLVETSRPIDQQMAFDESLAHDAWPTVRLFTWPGIAVSHGWKHAAPTWAAQAGVACIERPTAGAVALHGTDVSVSIVIPLGLGLGINTLMQTVCQSASRLCGAYGTPATVVLYPGSTTRHVTCCLADVAPYAVLVRDRKVAGFAVRRFTRAWLIQGSLLVRPAAPALARALPTEWADAVQQRSLPLALASEGTLTEVEVANRWAEYWSSWWEHMLLGQLCAV